MWSRTATGYRFTGTGSGHGVGLCVTGSARMAAQGRSAARILEAYFPGLAPEAADADGGAAPGRNPPSSRTSSCPFLPGRKGSGRTSSRLPQRAMDDISREAGVVPPAEVPLEFLPTVEAYQRVTGQPWWTAASTRDNRITLLPVSVLRQRGILDRTVRHEIAHVLTAPRLAGRPLWVVEGAAIFFAGELLAPPDDVACPADDELARSRSAEALRDAHARAGACFGRATASGLSWQAVRSSPPTVPPRGRQSDPRHPRARPTAAPGRR